MRSHRPSRNRAMRLFAVIAATAVLAGCSGPGPEEAPIPEGHVADLVGKPVLEEVLDYDDDLGSDVTPLVMGVASGFVVTTKIDAEAYDASHELPVSFWPEEYTVPVVVREGEEAPEITPPDDVAPFLPSLNGYTSDWEPEWSASLHRLLVQSPDSDPRVLDWTLLGAEGTDDIGLLGTSPSVVGPDWTDFMLVTVDHATGEELSWRLDPIPDEEGGYRVVWADGAIVVAAPDRLTPTWNLTRHDPADLDEPVWSIPLDEGLEQLTVVGDLLLVGAKDGSAVLRRVSDGSLVDWAGTFDDTTIYREVGGAIIRSVQGEGKFHLMRVDSDGEELWEQEITANRWGWPDDHLVVLDRAEDSDASIDLRYIDLDTGEDVWEKPAAGPFGAVVGFVGGHVLLDGYVPEDEREDPDKRSVLVLDAATGEQVLENHIEWYSHYLGENAYYVVTVDEETQARTVSAFGLDSVDPIWTLDVGVRQVVRYGHSLAAIDFEEGVLSRLAPGPE